MKRLREYQIMAWAGMLIFAVTAQAFLPISRCPNPLAGQGTDEPVVVIVDAYSSGNLLAPEFSALGARMVHVRSGLSVGKRLRESFNSDHFEADFDSSGSLERTWQYLQQYPVALVIPGAESGVLFAEGLADRMGTPTNDPLLAQARRNKWFMIEANRCEDCVRDGVNVPEQTRVTDPRDASRWIARTLGTWSEIGSVIVKAPMGAAGDQVFAVRSEAELARAVRAIMQGRDHYGQRNEYAIVQRRIFGGTRGGEYAVNGAAYWDGEELHVRITDAWKYHKIAVARGPQYGFEELIPFIELPRGILRFVKRVLRQLGYRHGAFHLELIVDENGAMFLIEVGARLYGAGGPRIAGRAVDYGQLAATVDSYLFSDRLIERAAMPYRLSKHAAVFNVNGPESSRPLLVSHQALRDVRDLLGDAMFDMQSFYDDDSPLVPTTTLSDTLFQFELLHESRALILERIATLNQWQNQGRFWRLAP